MNKKVLLIVLFLSGCGTTHYTWSGNTEEEFKLIDYQCQRENQRTVGGGIYTIPQIYNLSAQVHSFPTQVILDRKMYVKCMEANGFVQISK